MTGFGSFVEKTATPFTNPMFLFGTNTGGCSFRTSYGFYNSLPLPSTSGNRVSLGEVDALCGHALTRVMAGRLFCCCERTVHFWQHGCA
jgi:hypothetical protein